MDDVKVEYLMLGRVSTAFRSMDPSLAFTRSTNFCVSRTSEPTERCCPGCDCDCEFDGDLIGVGGSGDVSMLTGVDS